MSDIVTFRQQLCLVESAKLTFMSQSVSENPMAQTLTRGVGFNLK
jgi:hypothetical protein